MPVKASRKRAAAAADSEDEEHRDAPPSPLSACPCVRTIGASVYFHTRVTRISVLALLERLEEAKLSATMNVAPGSVPVVHLYIHSEGGDVYAGLSAMAHLRRSSTRIVTVVDGFVASAATLLLLGSQTRLCMRHGSVLIHQLRTSFWGKYDELLDEASNSRMLMNALSDVYRTETKLSAKRISELLSKEINLSDDECVKAGIVSAIV